MAMRISVVTPTKRIVENASATDVTIPGGNGQLQILPNHTELMTTLAPGIMSYRDENGKPHYLAISFGYAEVQNNSISVMAHTAETQFDIDLERAKSAQKRAEEALSRGVGHDQFIKYELKWHRSVIRQQVANMEKMNH